MASGNRVAVLLTQDTFVCTRVDDAVVLNLRNDQAMHGLCDVIDL
jgi:hypothetical protein